MVEEHRLRPNHVADRHQGEIEPVGAAGLGVDRGRAGRAHARANDVRADDEVAVGIHRLAGADQGLPPAGLAGERVSVREMLVAGQGVADQHRVRAVGIEGAGGLVGDLEGREAHARIRQERPVGSEARHGALRIEGLRRLRDERGGPFRGVRPGGRVQSGIHVRVFDGTAGCTTPCGTKPEVIAPTRSVNAERPPSPAGSADGGGAAHEDEPRPRRRDEAVRQRARIPPAQAQFRRHRDQDSEHEQRAWKKIVQHRRRAPVDPAALRTAG